MKLSKKDYRETKKVSETIKYIDSVDGKYITSCIDEINERQPFIISLLLRYKLDFNEKELEEITKLLLIIWEYFKDIEIISGNNITEKQFEKIQRRNIYMLKYIEGKQTHNEVIAIISMDLEHLRSKALLSGLFLRIKTIEDLINMKGAMKGIIMIGMKSLIECFEEL
jgi:hypothetical protein